MDNLPWLVWLSGLSAGLQTKRLLVWFPVRAHAWVDGQVPRWGRGRSNRLMYFSHIDVSLPLFLSPPPLKVNKQNFLKKDNPVESWARHLNKHIRKKDIQKANVQMKRCSVLLLMREMQTKTTMSYHYTSSAMVKIRTPDMATCWWGCEAMEMPKHGWREEKKLLQSLWKTFW